MRAARLKISEDLILNAHKSVRSIWKFNFSKGIKILKDCWQWVERAHYFCLSWRRVTCHFLTHTHSSLLKVLKHACMYFPYTHGLFYSFYGFDSVLWQSLFEGHWQTSKNLLPLKAFNWNLKEVLGSKALMWALSQLDWP